MIDCEKHLLIAGSGLGALLLERLSVDYDNSNNELGYESTHSTHSTSTSVESYGSYGDGEAPSEQPRRQRYRRQGSVTKYSIESTTEVQQENQDLCQPNREYTKSADGMDDTHGDPSSKGGKKPRKVNKMIKGLRQMSKRRFSTY